MLKTVIASLLISTSALASPTPVLDAPGQVPQKIALLVGDDNITTLHSSLIATLPTTRFYVFVGTSVKELPAAYSASNVTVQRLNVPLTSWAQDRLVRLTESGQAVTTAIMADHVKDSTASPYELTIPRRLVELGAVAALPATPTFISRPGPRDIEITSVEREGYERGVVWNQLYGDGGDRITLSKRAFIGRSTLEKIYRNTPNKTLADVERLLGRPVVALDSATEFERYSYHVDLYALPIGDTVVLASATETLRRFGNEQWLDREKLERMASREAQLDADLAGLKVIKVPLLITKAEGLVTLTNGIFAGNRYLSVDYALSGAARATLKQLQVEFAEVLKAEGLDVSFLAGGERNIVNGGQLRCTAAVLQ